MKAFGKAVLPRAVGVIFVIYPAWMFCTQLTSNLLLEIPIYLSLTSLLFKRSRGYPLAALLLPLWLVCSAEDDLLEYVEAMRGFHTPEELEAKRRELGLPERKRK